MKHSAPTQSIPFLSPSIPPAGFAPSPPFPADSPLCSRHPSQPNQWCLHYSFCKTKWVGKNIKPSQKWNPQQEKQRWPTSWSFGFDHHLDRRSSPISFAFCSDSKVVGQMVLYGVIQKFQKFEFAREWLWVHRKTDRSLSTQPYWISVASGVELSGWVYCWWKYFHNCFREFAVLRWLTWESSVSKNFCFKLGKTAAETHQMLKHAFWWQQTCSTREGWNQ
jgi:hypothetical protein